MSHFVVDVEADGPIPGDFSMIAIGAVMIGPEGELEETFHGLLRPISVNWVPEALAVSGFTREETLGFPPSMQTIHNFSAWVKRVTIGHPIFWADNNGFDWMFTCWYLHHFTGENPFGFSSKNINSLFHGYKRDTRASFKGLRKTRHTHNPVDDAMGNAEALLAIRDRGVKIKL